MQWLGDEQVKIIDVDVEAETAVVLANGVVYSNVPISDIVTDVSKEFDRLSSIKTSLKCIVGRIQSTDGETGTLLAKVRNVIIDEMRGDHY